jgi:hypothetical protein
MKVGRVVIDKLMRAGVAHDPRFLTTFNAKVQLGCSIYEAIY